LSDQKQTTVPKSILKPVPKPEKAQRKMSIGSLPTTFKKIKTVIDARTTSGTPVTPAEKLDLKMVGMYAEYVKDAIDGILENMVYSKITSKFLDW